MTDWASEYIGISYLDGGRGRDGADCWGLVCLVYWEQFGIRLPTYTGRYASAADKTEAAALVAGGMSIWHPVCPGEARAGDVMLFRYASGEAAHVGLALEPIGSLLGPRRMLHVHAGIDTTVVDLHRRVLGVKWYDRLEMIGRYAP